MAIMLKKACYVRRSLSDEQVEQQAIRYLAMNEISKDIMADELGVAREDLVIVSQQEYHIDIFIRPLADGRVLVHDYEEARKLIQKVLDDPKNELTEQNKIDLQQTMLKLQQLHEQRLPISKLIEQQLRDSGLQPIKAPGVFSMGEEIPIGKVGTEGYRMSNRHVNYMNGVMGTSQEDNSMFYITNAASIEPLNLAFSNWLKGYMPELQVEFIGKGKIGENNKNIPADFNFAEYLLGLNGGFDCISLHHGTATESLAENMASFPVQNEAVSSGPLPDTTAAVATFTHSLYSVKNDERVA